MDSLNLSTRQKNILFILLLVVVTLIIGLIFTAVDNSQKHTLTIRTLPETDKISLNNVSISKKVSLYPGVYELKTEAEGFATDIQKITIDRDFSVDVLLIPVSEESKKWFNDNAGLYSEGYDPSLTYHPIQNQLPFENSIFSIEAADISVEKEVITLDITALPGYRNAPISKISAMGYNPEDYLYNFNYKNPFENE